MTEQVQDFQASYIPPNMEFMVNEWDEGTEKGEPSRIEALDKIFAWKRGFISGWYGWANDGKGTFFDFAATVKAKIDGWKFCMWKSEDMSSRRDSKKKMIITADDIYNNIAWTLTGKTPYRHYAKKHDLQQIPLSEYTEIIEWVSTKFFVIFPQDRRYKNIIDNYWFMYEKYGIDVFLGDPFKAFTLTEDKRADKMLDDLFIDFKLFSLATNSSVNFIAHPKSMTDVKDKDGRYKVVNQYHIAGGAAFDNNLDSQYSIYRPNRHLNPADPWVEFYNLKQRKAEQVGVTKGMYDKIVFDPHTKRYFFNGVCPLDGSVMEITPPTESKKATKKSSVKQQEDIFATTKAISPDDVPF